MRNLPGAVPQDAKTMNSDAARVREMLRAGEKVILSVAPSYIACYSMKDRAVCRGNEGIGAFSAFPKQAKGRPMLRLSTTSF